MGEDLPGITWHEGSQRYYNGDSKSTLRKKCLGGLGLRVVTLVGYHTGLPQTRQLLKFLHEANEVRKDPDLSKRSKKCEIREIWKVRKGKAKIRSRERARDRAYQSKLVWATAKGVVARGDEIFDCRAEIAQQEIEHVGELKRCIMPCFQPITYRGVEKRRAIARALERELAVADALEEGGEAQVAQV